MPDAKQRAREILEELRSLLPGKAVEIEALARKLSGDNKERLTLRIDATASLVKIERHWNPSEKSVDTTAISSTTPCR